MSVKERIIYSGQYRDIKYSINKFANPMKESELCFSKDSESDFNWCHYIFLNLDKQIEDEKIREELWLKPEYDDKGRCSYPYYNSIINEVEFHGGCTYYSKESSVDDKERCIKVGCDYQHSWDVGKEYSIEYITTQVHETIDSFLKKVSPVLKWCNGCGAFFKDVTKNGCGKCKYSQDKY